MPKSLARLMFVLDKKYVGDKHSMFVNKKLGDQHHVANLNRQIL